MKTLGSNPLDRWKAYQKVRLKAKEIQRFPPIVDDPTADSIIRLMKKNEIGYSCRGIVSEQDGLIVFDSSRYTHAQVMSVLEDEYHLVLPKKLKPEHQLTFVSSPQIDYKRAFIFTSQRAAVDPRVDLQKYERNWSKIAAVLNPVYVNYDQYDDVRYYLETAKDEENLWKALRSVLDV